MGALYVPILDSSSPSGGNLFSVTCKKQESVYTCSRFNGVFNNSVRFFNEKLGAYFAPDTFSFKILNENETDPHRRPFKNFSEKVTSISLGLFCAAYKTAKNRAYREKYDSITVTGDFRAVDKNVQLVKVKDIKEKYKLVQDYAGRNADKNHLFIYISSEEIIPDGLQENNVLVIRYDSIFPVKCIFAEVFEDINEDTSTPQKYRNEFIETRSFINLKKEIISDRSYNCYIIKGKSNTGKSFAAEALCKYLVNTQTISGYVWFYIGDNGKLLELLRKEKEEQVNSAIDIGFEGEHEKRNYVKETYPEVFDRFDMLLQTDKNCAIIIDNIEYDIVDEVLSFFNLNYPMENNKYDLILTSWEGSRINLIENSIKTRTINISNISLDFKELKAIADSVIKINDYGKKYYEAPENSKNDLLDLLFSLCRNYPGYIPLVLSALNEYSMEETLKIYKEKDVSDLSSIDKILTITFATMDFLSRIVLFAYLQIKNFDEALKTDKIIDILKKKIFNSTPVIDDNDIRRSLNVLQQYSFLTERAVGHYEIKNAVLDFAVFSKDIPDELQTAREMIVTPERKVEYAIEEKKLKEFIVYINMISEKETLNDTLIKLCKSDSSLEFFEALLAKGEVDVNYTSEYGIPLQICAKTTSDTRILDFLISKGADWRKKNNKGETFLHNAVSNEDGAILRYILKNHYYNNINEADNDGWTALHKACFYSKDTRLIELLLKYGADKESRVKNGGTLFHCAAANEDCTMLNYILEHYYYSDINEPDSTGRTPLHWTCETSKDTKSIELLLKYGADRNKKDNNGRTLLYHAAINKDTTVLRYLLEHKLCGNINEMDKYGNTPLHVALVNSKNTKSIELLLEYGADRRASANGLTLIHCAARNKDCVMLSYILEGHYYGDINEPDSNGCTSLHWACNRGKDTKSIELLLKYGADSGARDNDGETVFHLAAANEDSSILRYMLERHYYGDINEADDKGRIPLNLACANSKDTKSVELLLEYGADREAVTNDGRTMLHYAAENKDSTILSYMLEHHYYNDINKFANVGITPLHVACFHSKDEKSIELLLKYGADKKLKTNNGKTLLHCAAANEDSTILSYILKHCYYGDINETDNDGRTPLHWACETGRDTKSIELLLEYGANRETRSNYGGTLLHHAVLNDDSTMLMYILEHHCYDNINEMTNKGYTPLHFTCNKSKNIKSLELLLEYGADREARTDNGGKLLHCAAANKDSTMLKYILERHYYGDINELDNSGRTPLHWACNKSKDEKSIELLLEYGADRNARTNVGESLLHHAAANENNSILMYMLEHHYYSDINDTDDNGWTPLHQACRFNNKAKSIELLLEYGADKKLKTNDGLSLLHCAAKNNYSIALRYILKNHYYGNINEFDNENRTALYWTCFNSKNIKSIELLLDHGADPKAITIKGNNILHAAALSNRKEIVEYILKHLPVIDPAQKNFEGKTAAELTTDDDIKKLLGCSS